MTIMASASVSPRLRAHEVDTVKILQPIGCPSWCVIETVGDTPAQVLHIGNDHHVHATSPDGRDVSDIEISLEASLDTPTTIRLQGAADAPMSPAQALELAHQLVLAAREAYGIPR